MHRYHRTLRLGRPGLLAFLLCVLGICGTALPPQAAGLDEMAPTPLQYYQWTKTASAESIAAERARIAEDTLTSDPMITAVQLGLLLSAPALASPAAEQDALLLLDTALHQPPATRPDSEYRIFAELLHAHLQQRNELRAADAAGLASHAEIQRLEDSNRLLQEKISALTSLEEQLIQREQGQRP